MNPQLTQFLAQQRSAELRQVADGTRRGARASAANGTVRRATLRSRLSARTGRATGPIAPGNC
jgi:hypothetical protein